MSFVRCAGKCLYDSPVIGAREKLEKFPPHRAEDATQRETSGEDIRSEWRWQSAHKNSRAGSDEKNSSELCDEIVWMQCSFAVLSPLKIMKQRAECGSLKLHCATSSLPAFLQYLQDLGTHYITRDMLVIAIVTRSPATGSVLMTTT